VIRRADSQNYEGGGSIFIDGIPTVKLAAFLATGGKTP